MLCTLVVTKMANARIDAVETGLARLQAQVNDIGRQTSKCSIVFEGSLVKLLDKELPKDALFRIVHMGWGFVPADWEVADAKIHQQGRTGKFRMLGFFNARYEGSTFHRILTTRPKAPGGTLYRRLHMVTPNDHRMNFIARTMKKGDELKNFIWHFASGRLKVTFKNDDRRTFSEAKDLYAKCSERLQAKIDAEDKAQKSRKRNKPESDMEVS